MFHPCKHADATACRLMAASVTMHDNKQWQQAVYSRNHNLLLVQLIKFDLSLCHFSAHNVMQWWIFACQHEVLDVKRSVGGAKDQLHRNYGSVVVAAVATACRWILKWKLQGYHCCRCTHLPTHSCGDRDGILSSDCSARIA